MDKARLSTLPDSGPYKVWGLCRALSPWSDYSTGNLLCSYYLYQKPIEIGYEDRDGTG